MNGKEPKCEEGLAMVVYKDPEGNFAVPSHNLTLKEAMASATESRKAVGGNFFALPQRLGRHPGEPETCTSCDAEYEAFTGAGRKVHQDES